MIILVIILITVGLTTSVLALFATVVFASSVEKPRSQRSGVATLILPVTGSAPNLERLLAALEHQTLPARRLLLAIESEQDPVFARAVALTQTSALAVEIVITGAALSTAQKCWNQIIALRRVDERDDVIVLLDADILPQSWWLSALVSPLIDDFCDVVTGYRWLSIEKPTLGAHLVAAIDRSIAVLPRPPFTRVVWGGTLALSRHALHKLELPVTLASTLSDDCTIGDEAAARGLRMLTRRALLMASPLDVGLSQAWHFGRRQYQIGHLYRPWLFAMALAGIGARLLAWGIIVLALIGQQSLLWAIGPALLFVVCGLGSYVGQQIAARRLGIGDPLSVALVQVALAAAKPVVDLFHLSMLVAAIDYRRVRWGHVVYRVGGAHDVKVEKRLSWPS